MARRYATRSDLYEATALLLGAPVINIEISADQYSAVCDSCIDEFTLEASGDGGVYESYLFLTVTSGVSVYSTSAYDMSSIKNLQFNNGLGQVNQLFTAQHNLLTDQSGKFRLFNNTVGNSSPGMELATYQGAMQYLELAKEMLSKDYWATLREQEQELTVYPTPKETMTGLLTYFKKETEVNIFNNILFRNLFKAAAKNMWGQNLGKYGDITMPGGGAVAASRIITEAQAEYTVALERIRAQAEPCPFSVY
jgi:hypothetical protein